ncbi:MAG: M48 family metallopeptidase [Tepidisphaeraceae bacterium]
MPSTALRHLTLILLAVVLGGCAMSGEKEIQLGMESHPKFEQEFGGRYPDSQIQAYVNGVGMNVARYAGRPNLPWQFAVLNSEQINAFAVPGGFCYITQGLLFEMKNESMLAGVLGHEAAHIAHRHSVQQIQRAQQAQGLSMTVGIVGGLFGYGWAGDVTNVVASLTLLTYSRGQEKEADLSGLKYMVQASYNPQGMVQTMTVLQQASGGGKGGSPEFLSSHPNPGNRLEYLAEIIQKKYAAYAQTGKVGEEEFRQNVLARRVAKVAQLPPPRVEGWCSLCRPPAGDTSGRKIGTVTYFLPRK